MLYYCYLSFALSIVIPEAWDATTPLSNLYQANLSLDDPKDEKKEDAQPDFSRAFTDLVLAIRAQDAELLKDKAMAKKWPEQKEFIKSAMANFKLKAVRGVTDEEVVIEHITTSKESKPLSFPVGWILDLAADAPTIKKAIIYLKAADAEISRRMTQNDERLKLLRKEDAGLTRAIFDKYLPKEKERNKFIYSHLDHEIPEELCKLILDKRKDPKYYTEVEKSFVKYAEEEQKCYSYMMLRLHCANEIKLLDAMLPENKHLPKAPLPGGKDK